MYQNRPSNCISYHLTRRYKYLFLQDLQQLCQNQSEHHLTVFCINPNDLALLFIITSIPVLQSSIHLTIAEQQRSSHLTVGLEYPLLTIRLIGQTQASLTQRKLGMDIHNGFQFFMKLYLIFLCNDELIWNLIYCIFRLIIPK